MKDLTPGRATLLVTGLSTALACPPPPTDDPPEPVDPAALVAELGAPGAWGVGYQTEVLSYDDGFGAEPREAHAAYWYPTDETGGDIRYRDLFPATSVTEGAALVGSDLPVALFSHGSQAYSEAASYLAQHLASHGWLVAAVDHVGNTIFDPSDREATIYLQRPRDISALLDRVEAFPSDHPLAGSAGGPVLNFGHSFGGYTVLALAGASYAVDDMLAGCPEGTFNSTLCEALDDSMIAALEAGAGDPRIDGFSPMAAGNLEMFGAAGLAEVAGPVLQFTGGLDTGADNEAIYDALAPESRARVHLPTGGHNSFVDLADTFRPEEGQIPGAEGHRIVATYMLAFARSLQGDETVEGILDGSVTVDPGAELLR